MRSEKIVWWLCSWIHFIVSKLKFLSHPPTKRNKWRELFSLIKISRRWARSSEEKKQFVLAFFPFRLHIHSTPRFPFAFIKENEFHNGSIISCKFTGWKCSPWILSCIYDTHPCIRSLLLLPLLKARSIVTTVLEFSHSLHVYLLLPA